MCVRLKSRPPISQHSLGDRKSEVGDSGSEVRFRYDGYDTKGKTCITLFGPLPVALPQPGHEIKRSPMLLPHYPLSAGGYSFHCGRYDMKTRYVDPHVYPPYRLSRSALRLADLSIKQKYPQRPVRTPREAVFGIASRPPNGLHSREVFGDERRIALRVYTKHVPPVFRSRGTYSRR